MHMQNLRGACGKAFAEGKEKACGAASVPQAFHVFEFYFVERFSLIAACAAARRAIGTRNGEQET